MYSPVVEIVMEVAISDTKFMLFHEFLILLDVKSIENIVPLIFGHDKGVLD